MRDGVLKSPRMNPGSSADRCRCSVSDLRPPCCRDLNVHEHHCELSKFTRQIKRPKRDGQDLVVLTAGLFSYGKLFLSVNIHSPPPTDFPDFTWSLSARLTANPHSSKV